MPNPADTLRRWFGLFFLAIAFGMLVWGQTVLREYLQKRFVLFTIYWFACFAFTIAAIVTALLDLRATRMRARREHEALIQRTLDQVDRDAQENSGKPKE